MDTALILAGGESARFGRPKALVDVGGKAMVSRVVDAVEPLAAEIVISVGSAHMADAIESVLSRAKFVVDRRHGLGPIEGMTRGFEIARGTRVLVAPCDAPLLRSDLYRTLLRAMGRHDAAVPKFDVVDPVRAVYRRTAVLRIIAKANAPLPSPSSLADRLDTVFLSERRLRSMDPRLDSFLDVNHEEDLAEALRRLESA